MSYRGTLDKYLPLVDRITTREELSDLIGWAVGELSALHTAVRGGDVRRGPDKVTVPAWAPGSSAIRPGADIESTTSTGPIPTTPTSARRSPTPISESRSGDVITAVNGRATLSVDDIGVLLRDQAEKQVLLTVGREAPRPATWWSSPPPTSSTFGTATGSHPPPDYRGKSRGTMGYVHLRAMSPGDLDQWYREFYPVFDRQGLIIDVRNNRGGNIDSFILEKLIRKAWMYWKSRVGAPYWNMQFAFRGHVVVLVDQETASDGEAFAEGVQAARARHRDRRAHLGRRDLAQRHQHPERRRRGPGADEWASTAPTASG